MTLHGRGQGLCSGAAGQHTTNSEVFLWTFSFIVAFFGLSGLCLFVLIFCGFFWEGVVLFFV